MLFLRGVQRISDTRLLMITLDYCRYQFGSLASRKIWLWPCTEAICFCEDAIGCPQPNQVSTLQHIGELRVLSLHALGTFSK